MRLAIIGALAALALAVTSTPAHAAGRSCNNTWWTSVTVPETVVLKADRLRAQGGMSCLDARSIVRSFLWKQATDPDCAAAAASRDEECVVRGYGCNKVVSSRAYCEDQGVGVTFRERDRDIG